MLTNNGKVFLYPGFRAYDTGRSTWRNTGRQESDNATTVFGCKRLNGDNQDFYKIINNESHKFNYMHFIRNLAILVGGGNSATRPDTVTLDQYFNPQILTSVGGSCRNNDYSSCRVDNFPHIIQCSRSFINNGSSNIVIKEVGIASLFEDSDDNSIEYYYNIRHPYNGFNDWILIAREVLANPVTVPPGEMVTFNMVIG